MGHYLRKEKGVLFNNIGRLGMISFVLILALAMVDSIWAVYIGSFFQDSSNAISIVGFISGFLTLISFLFFFFSVPIIEKWNKCRIYLYSLLILGIAYILFAINKNFYIFILLAVVITILQALRITSFGIIVRDKSSDRKLTKNEGLMYTFMNVAWVIGPLISGFISEKYGISLVFVLSSIFVFLAFFLFKILDIQDENIKKKVDKRFIKNFLDFFKSRERLISYALTGGVNFWWSLIYLFIPLLIIQNGLGTKWVGYFLFAVAVPLIFFSYMFSKIASKSGFRKMFKIGYSIPLILSFACFFVSNIYLILGLMVLSSIGFAMLESTTESYFLNITKKQDICRFYGPYNTNIDISHLISRVLSAVLLLFLPFKFLFLFYSFFMLIIFLISFKSKDVIKNK